ncbi:MAG: hypothetical protein Q9163_004494 [Psora crenata]
MELAMELDNYDKAIEIEIVAEQWYEKISRDDVLERLRKVYLQDEPTTRLDQAAIMKRQAAIKKLLTNQSLATDSDAKTGAIAGASKYGEASSSMSDTVPLIVGSSEPGVHGPTSAPCTVGSEATPTLTVDKALHQQVEGDGAPSPQQHCEENKGEDNNDEDINGEDINGEDNKGEDNKDDNKDKGKGKSKEN